MIQKLKGSHPNLLRLYGWVFPKPDVLHVVMEKAEKSLLCALKELASAWARSSLSKLITRIKMALDVAEGLKAIHEIGYIHEDIKPGNILVCLSNLMSHEDLTRLALFMFCFVATKPDISHSTHNQLLT